MQTQEKFQGVIGRFYSERHFGFIRYIQGEIFFHHFDFVGLGEPVKGQTVEFEIGEYNSKPVAKKVMAIHKSGSIIPATEAEIDLLKSYGVDLTNGSKVRAALSAIRSIVKDGEQ